MQPITWNQQVVKKNNKSLVLQTVIAQEPISRADIAQLTGLNKATVSSLINELLEEELVYESGAGESSGGRRPVILHYNRVAGFSIGIDIGVNYILSVLTNLKGEILKEKSQPITDSSYSIVIGHVKQMIRSLMDSIPPSKYRIVGLAIGVPGIVDNKGTIISAPNLGWKNINIKEEIEAEFDIPVCIENEANAGAYGEKRFGAGQNSQNLLYISAGIGIGVGIIINGELYRGQSGFSGEIGHTIINVNGKPCRCGSKGCWEVYASENALLFMTNQEDATLESLIQLAENNDKGTIKLFEQIGYYLGYGINNIINSFNPGQVIIGNRLAMAQRWIEGPIRETIQSCTLSFNQGNSQLHFSQLLKYSTALGTAAFAIENFTDSLPDLC
ncbi:ROK family protein [Neobacillus novalis]|uniref:ROK family protein n=1 Tax=Neobacillus novalis TaxID=220687 RepID=A0AA95SB09_9BACI|nr:ROK family protein [Neobacillus novalis]WHY86024.1 ROK family protein [Neobacillus novalis]